MICTHVLNRGGLGVRSPLDGVLSKHYVPYFEKDMSRLGAAIDHPPTWSALKAAGERALPANVAPDDDPADHSGKGPRDDEDGPIKGR